MADVDDSGASAAVLLCKSCGVGKCRPGKGPKCHACYHQAQKVRRIAAKAAVAAGTYEPGSFHREATCEGCGKVFPVFRPDYHRFCSRRCAGIGVHAPEEIARRDRERRKANKRKATDRRQAERAADPKTCPVCSAVFIGKAKTQVACGPKCRAEGARREARRQAQANDQRDRSPRQCRECAASFTPEYGNKRRIFCSDECLLRASRRIGKALRRVRSRKARAERVDPFVVFRRDNFRCHLCGLRTPSKLRGTHDPRAPELDHIVPLSRGGEHSYANTACSCRACNLRKGNKPLGQMMLAV